MSDNPVFPPYKVLIVDDSQLFREYMSRYLKKAGLVIVGEAENGEEAIKMFVKTQPDIVTLDITMPKINGLKVLEQIMKLKPDTTVIVVSSNRSEDIVKKAIMLGAKHYILKPAQEDAILKAVKVALERSGRKPEKVSETSG